MGEQRDPYAQTYAQWRGNPPPGPQPYGSQWPPHPGWGPPPPAAGGALRIVAASLLVVAAVLVLIAILLPLSTYTYTSEYLNSTTVRTAWGSTEDPPADRAQYFAYSALLLTVASAISAITAVVLLAARGAVRGVARTLGAATSAAVAAVGLVLVSGLLQGAQSQLDYPDEPGYSSTFTIEAGGWFLLAGTIVSTLAAGLLVCLRDR